MGADISPALRTRLPFLLEEPVGLSQTREIGPLVIGRRNPPIKIVSGPQQSQLRKFLFPV